MVIRPKMKVIKVVSKLEEGFKVVSKADGHTIIQDLPKPLGGADSGPTPTALILASLAGCICIVARFHAERKGIKIEDMEVTVSGEFDPRGFAGEDVKPGFQKIEVEVKIKSPNTEEEIKKFIEFVEKHCPIEDTVVSPTKVEVKITKV
ncbi:MAG TPA: OsmC family peroxiredoxin [Acidilobales archaeon]|nr:MAG: peroxiredoxin [Desulfurococcales archaeon ex4484_42]HDD26458.1 OsmC family peroxiredoxin [Acidilobales archaeon]